MKKSKDILTSHFKLEKGYKYTICVENKSLFKFRYVGNIDNKESGGIDALDVIADFDLFELQVLKEVNQEMDDYNEWKISKQSTVHMEGIVSWIDKNLMVEKSEGNYIINPHFIVPFESENEEVILNAWERFSPVKNKLEDFLIIGSEYL